MDEAKKFAYAELTHCSSCKRFQMVNTSIDSRLMSFGELLTGSNYYAVPNFQRDYSWTETEVEELWTDITNTIGENRNEHFFGAIVVNNSEKPKLWLIDGQQRMTTTSLLVCAIRDIAREKEDAELSTIISQKYLGSLDSRTRRTEPKLILNDTNNQFYQDNFIQFKDISFLKSLQKKLTQGQHKSNKLMLGAYLLLYKKIHERASKAENFIESLIQIEECIRDKLNAIVISVADESNSYLIFETLNNRGLELSVADLLKNHLFSKSYEKLSDIQRIWMDINREIDKFDLTRFIYHYWLSKYGDISEKELFRKISTQLKNSLDVLDFVTALRESAEIYGAFKNPQSSIWDSFHAETKDNIIRLKLFGVSECYPALLAAKETLPNGLFSKFLRMLVIFSFRYNVICGLNPRIESTYSEISTYIRKRKPKKETELFEKIVKLYPEDDFFFESFQKKIITKENADLARYILREINSYYTGHRELVANPNASEVNLEHILPQRPNETWLAKFSKTDFSHYIYRLGNLTLLDSKINRNVGNSSFQDKCNKAFARSNLEIAREIAEYSSWGPKQIEERQTKMAKAACEIWRLDYQGQR